MHFFLRISNCSDAKSVSKKLNVSESKSFARIDKAFRTHYMGKKKLDAHFKHIIKVVRF